VEYISGDLSVLSDIERLCEESKKKFPQGVDILVNNAGTLNVLKRPCLSHYTGILLLVPSAFVFRI